MNYVLITSGSEEELSDLKQAYLDGKGDMDFILEAVPFSHTDEEPRLRELIQGLMDKGDVPEYKAFTNEAPRKREQRKRRVIKYVSISVIWNMLHIPKQLLVLLCV
jgi:DnaJ family protein C protein 9